MTHNLPKNEAEKITKYENFFLVIRNIWKLKNVSLCPSEISAEGLVTRSFLKCLQNRKHLKGRAKRNITYNKDVTYGSQTPRIHPLTVGYTVNFLPLTDPNPTDRLGQAKVSQQADAERRGCLITIIIITITIKCHILLQSYIYIYVFAFPVIGH